MKFKYLSLLLVFLFTLPLFGENKKIDEEDEATILSITEKDIEEEIIKNLDLLKNYNLVENLQKYQEIMEMMDYEDDN